MNPNSLAALFSASPSGTDVIAVSTWAYLLPRASLDPPHDEAEEIGSFRVWRRRERIWIFDSASGEYRIVRLNESRRPVRLCRVEKIETRLSWFHREITFAVTETVWGKQPKKPPRLVVYRLTGYGTAAAIFATVAALLSGPHRQDSKLINLRPITIGCISPF